MFFVTLGLWPQKDSGTWVKPGDFDDISISRTLHFVHGTGLLDA